MKRGFLTMAACALALLAALPAEARKDDIDLTRLSGSLDQLANDPGLGRYANAEQARARDAVNRLAQAGSRDRAHALYLAERRVDLARTAAQVQDAQAKLDQLDREHAQLQLANSRLDAEIARRELERQRLQYQLAQEEAARLAAQGEEYSQAAEKAKAEADRAKRLAAAQSRVAKAAKEQAKLATEAAKALRSQMEDPGSTPAESH